MLIRLLFVIGLLIGLMMPCAHADTWGEQETNEWKEMLAKPYNEYMKGDFAKDEFLSKNSPLAKLIIQTDEWFEGDTYYIRYTFTNPTDEAIDETISRSFIRLQAARAYDIASSIIKRDPAPEWMLRVEPHSSVSHTIMLPKEPVFSHFIHDSSFFYLSSGGTLCYYWLERDITPPAKIDYHFEPTALNKATLTLTVTNQSNTTLSTLKNILIPYKDFTKDDWKFRFYPLSDSFTLDLAPNESTDIHLTVPIPFYLSDDPEIHMSTPCVEIDGIQYYHFVYGEGQALSKRVISYSPRAYVTPYYPPEVSITGTMEIIYGYPVYFLTFYNDTDKTQVLRTLHMSSFYENLSYAQKCICFELSLEKEPIVLHPRESKRYWILLSSFTDTPQQCLESITAFDKESISYHQSKDLPKIIARPLHPIERALYKPLAFTVTEARGNQYSPEFP